MESTSDLKDSSCQEETKDAAPQIKDAATKSTEVTSNHYFNVHFFEKTGRWGAWVRCAETKKRLYLGTHKSQHLAARCQDRANLKLKNKPATLNFCERDYDEDNEMREKLSDAEFLKFLRAESRNRYKRMDKSLCLQKFLAQERDFDESSSQRGQKSSCATTFVAAKERISLSQDVLEIPTEYCTTIVNAQHVLQTITEESEKLNDVIPSPLTGIPKRPRSIMINTPRVARSGLLGVGHAVSSTLLPDTPSGVQTASRSSARSPFKRDRIVRTLAEEKSSTHPQLLVQTTFTSCLNAVESVPTDAHPISVATEESPALPAKLRLKKKREISSDLLERRGAPTIPELRIAQKEFTYLHAYKGKGYSLDVLAAFALEVPLPGLDC